MTHSPDCMELAAVVVSDCYSHLEWNQALSLGGEWLEDGTSSCGCSDHWMSLTEAQRNET
jgi:hypothetical protein